jgi:hypothetical protein
MANLGDTTINGDLMVANASEGGNSNKEFDFYQ